MANVLCRALHAGVIVGEIELREVTLCRATGPSLSICAHHSMNEIGMLFCLDSRELEVT